jgi:hypothetical protein
MVSVPHRTPKHWRPSRFDPGKGEWGIGTRRVLIRMDGVEYRLQDHRAQAKIRFAGWTSDAVILFLNTS